MLRATNGGLAGTGSLQSLSSQLGRAQSCLLASYQGSSAAELAAAEDFKAVRAATANTMLVLPDVLLPLSLEGTRHYREYIENFKYLTFQQFQHNLPDILADLKEFSKHAEMVRRMYQYYARDVQALQGAASKRVRRLQEKAGAAIREGSTKDAQGTAMQFGGLLAMMAGAALVAGAAALPGGLVLAGSVGAMSQGGELKNDARALREEAEQCNAVAAGVQTHLLPALQPLAELAASLEAFFLDQRSQLEGRTSFVEDALSRGRRLQRQFQLMQGWAKAMSAECREFEQAASKASSQLQVIADVARRAGDLKPGFSQAWAWSARNQAVLC